MKTVIPLLREASAIGQRKSVVSDEEAQSAGTSALSALNPLNAADMLFTGLDTPMAIGTSLVKAAGGGGWVNPFGEDRILPSDLIGENIYGRDLNMAEKMFYDTVLDPVNLLPPVKGLGVGARIAKRAGLLDGVGAAATRKLRSDALDNVRQGYNQRKVMNAKKAARRQGQRLGVQGDRLGDALETAADANKFDKRRIRRALDDAKQSVDTYNLEDARPLVGDRQAMRNLSARDLIDLSPDPTEALRRFTNAFDKFKVKDDLQTILDSKLGGQAVGGGLFPTDLGMSAGLANQYAGFMDNAADYLRYNTPVGRTANRVWDSRVRNQSTPLGQMIGRQAGLSIDKAEEFAKGTTGRLTRRLREISDAIPEPVKQKYGLTDDLVSDKQFMHAVDRIIEGNAKTRLDREMLRDMPELRTWVADYHKTNRNILNISKRAGTQADQLKDPFNNKYRSYVGMQPAFKTDSPLLGAVRNKGLYQTVAGSQLQRMDSLRLPGGLDQRRYIGNNFAEILKRQYPNLEIADLTEKQIADALFNDIAGQSAKNYYDTIPGSRLANNLAKGINPLSGVRHGRGPMPVGKSRTAAKRSAMDVARYIKGNLDEGLTGMSEEALQKMNQSPLEAMGKNLNERMRVAGYGDFMKNDLVNAIDMRRPKDVLTTQKTPLTPAMMANKLGLKNKNVTDDLKKGIADVVLQRTGKKLDVSQMKLSQFNIPAERLDAYMSLASREMQPGPLRNIMREVNKVFKPLILNYPRRYTRDLTSSGVMNGLHYGLNTLRNSYARAADLMAGNTDEIKRLLDDGTYVGYEAFGSADDKLKAFLNDLDKYDLLRSGAQVEYVQDLNTLGSNRVITEGLAGFGDRGMKQAIKGIPASMNPKQFFSKEGMESASAAGQKLNEAFDGIGRFAAVFEELRRGTPLEEAVRKANSIHVRYDDLSDIEKAIRDFIPFYSYNRGMAKYQLGSIMNNPNSPYMMALRGRRRMMDEDQSEDGQYIPEYIREGTGGVLPPGIEDGLRYMLGGDEDDTYMLQSLDFPGANAFDFGEIYFNENGGVNLGASTYGTANSLVNQAATPVKYLYQTASQRDPFNNSPLVQKQDPLMQAFQNLQVHLGKDPQEARDDGAGYGGLVDAALGVGSLIPATRPLVGAVSGASRYTNLLRDLTQPGATSEDTGIGRIGSNIVQEGFGMFAPFKVKRMNSDQRLRSLRNDLSNNLFARGTNSKPKSQRSELETKAMDAERLLNRNLRK